MIPVTRERIRRGDVEGRFWGQADINRQARPVGSVANDPQADIDRSEISHP